MAYCVQEQSHTVSSVSFNTPVADVLLSATRVTVKTATTVTVTTIFSTTASVRCLVVASGTTIANSASIMTSSLSSVALVANGGEPHTVTFGGLSKGTVYDAYCTQSSLSLPAPTTFTSLDFVEQPSVTYIGSKQVTISMKVAQIGNLSCMAVGNGDSIPSANDIVSIGK